MCDNWATQGGDALGSWQIKGDKEFGNSSVCKYKDEWCRTYQLSSKLCPWPSGLWRLCQLRLGHLIQACSLACIFSLCWQMIFLTTFFRFLVLMFESWQINLLMIFVLKLVAEWAFWMYVRRFTCEFQWSQTRVLQWQRRCPNVPQQSTGNWYYYVVDIANSLFICQDEDGNED